MIETGLLFLLAEISVALAGFSAIIGVLGSRSGRSEVRVDALRLQAMLETSFVVAAASILPALLDHFGIAVSASWRISSALFLLVQIPSEIIGIRRTKEMPDMTWSRFNVNTVNWSLSIGADLIMLGVLLNLFGAHTSGFYLLALFSLLTMAALLFIQFASSTFMPSKE